MFTYRWTSLAQNLEWSQTFRRLYSRHRQWQYKIGNAHLNILGEVKWREISGRDSYVMACMKQMN